MVPLLLLPLLWGGSLQEQPEYELRVQELVRVQEGLSVHVPCYFSFPRSSWYSSGTLYTYWYQNGDNIAIDDPVATNNRFKSARREFQNRFLLADPNTNNCSLSIRDSRMSDSGTYFFRMERGSGVKYSYKEKKLNLQVTDKPDIHFLEPLVSGRSTQLTCSLPGSCEKGRRLIFSWVGGALDLLNLKIPHSSVLTFTPRPQDHGTNLTCQVKCAGSVVITQRTIWLNVFYAPQNLTIGISFRNVTALKSVQNASSLLVLEGEAVRLLCEADSNPPAELTWFRGSPALNANPISSNGVLDLPRVGTAEEGEFSCWARHPLGSQTLFLSLSVLYPPQLLGPSCSWEDQGLHCSCSSRAQPGPSLRWRLGAGLLEGNHSNASYTVTSWLEGPWTNSSLSLSRELSAGLRLSCEASNVHGAQSAAVLLLPGKQEPKAGGVLGVVGEAVTMVLALLSLCLCLIFRVKTCREKAAQPVQSMDKDMSPVVGSGSRVPQHQFQTDSPSSPPASGVASPIVEEKQELHYAFLRFHNLKLQEQEDVNIEYSQIKTHK
ncbi:sialic acid-binding Ig-like lectin 5 isoform 1-T1 [Rhynchonycteris naso]